MEIELWVSGFQNKKGTKILFLVLLGVQFLNAKFTLRFFLLTQLYFSSGSSALRGLGGGAGWS